MKKKYQVLVDRMFQDIEAENEEEAKQIAREQLDMDDFAVWEVAE